MKGFYSQHRDPKAVRFRFAVLLLLLTAPLAADTTGILAGVVSGSDGEPLVGASVLVEGTSLGAMTDNRGEYAIAGLPPGFYDVTARMVGRTASRAEEVQVAVGQMTRLDFELQVDVTGHTEITVTESRSSILQDVPTTLHLLDLENIRTISSGSLLEMIASQPGVVTPDGEMYVRGGRAGEVD